MIDENTVKNNKDIIKNYELLQTWAWQFEKTLPFTQDFNYILPWAQVDLSLSVNKGTIVDIDVNSSQLKAQHVKLMRDILINLPFQKAVLLKKLDEVSLKDEKIEGLMISLAYSLCY